MSFRSPINTEGLRLLTSLNDSSFGSQSPGRSPSFSPGRSPSFSPCRSATSSPQTPRPESAADFRLKCDRPGRIRDADLTHPMTPARQFDYSNPMNRSDNCGFEPATAGAKWGAMEDLRQDLFQPAAVGDRWGAMEDSMSPCPVARRSQLFDSDREYSDLECSDKQYSGPDDSEKWNTYDRGVLGILSGDYTGPEAFSPSKIVLNLSPGCEASVNLSYEYPMVSPTFGIHPAAHSTPVKAPKSPPSPNRFFPSGLSLYDTINDTSYYTAMEHLPDESIMSTWHGGPRCPVPPELSMEASIPPKRPSTFATPPPTNLSCSPPPSVLTASRASGAIGCAAGPKLTATPAGRKSDVMKKVLQLTESMAQNENLTIQEGLRNYQQKRRQCIKM